MVEGGVRYRQTVVIRSYEVGPDKTATLETILNLLQIKMTRRIIYGEIDTGFTVSGKTGMRRDWLLRSRFLGQVFCRATIYEHKPRRLSKMPEEVRDEISLWFTEMRAVQEEALEKIEKLDDNAKYVNSNLNPK
ncbi:hypothetical protein OPV22_014470 [Ensete ventricosum]|uniref:Uncharacterized protein n=1 Tax=Ensete ventricosum TaxID=4639 RepID=A0AAV8R3B5_ENSVE|nr:hypothetical protein OPV22_014470 [Ensete ventricosum]